MTPDGENKSSDALVSVLNAKKSTFVKPYWPTNQSH